MKIRAQIGMVLNLDKCIGCHTCTSACKLQWTNRNGREYMYRSEEHTSELQSRETISYAVFCLKKKKNKTTHLDRRETEGQL